MWSTSPAATKSRMTVAPPPMRTSSPPAASRAAPSASAGDASMKWNVVPPSMSMDGPRMMGENEHRRVKRRVRAPPALPLRILVPAWRAELPRSHDLGADAGLVLTSEGVVHAAGAPGSAEHRPAPLRRDHPLMQPFAGMAERRVETLPVAGAEAVKRDREVLDTRERHEWLLPHCS